MLIALARPAAVATLVLLAVYGLGALLRRRAEPLERMTWGLAGWTVTLFVLAATGAYRPPVLVGLALVLAAVGGTVLVRDRPRSADAERAESPLRALLAGGVVALPIVSALALVFAITVNPTVSWDAAVYHLTLPDLYLRSGGFEVVPLLVYSVWPQAVEMLFGVALAIDDHVAAKALHFAFGVLVLATLWTAVRRRESAETVRVVGLVAVALFALNDVVLFEMRAAYVDLALALFALAAFLHLDRWLDADAGVESDAADRHLVTAGLACGLLAASKINGLLPAACIAVLAVPRLVRRAAIDRRGALRWAALLGVPIAILWAPWVVRTWILTGNPVYPLAHDLFGGPDWSDALSERFGHWQRSIGMGREPLDYVLLPWRVFTAGGQGYEHFDGRLTPLWLAALPFAAWGAWTSERARRAVTVALLFFATWAASSQQMRFLVPALPLLALAAADGVSALLQAGAARRLVATPARARVLVATAVVAWLVAFGVQHERLLRSGASHLELYADPRFERPAAPPSPPVFGAIAALPEHSTVLLLNTNHLFHCRPTTCWGDSFFEASQISDWLGDAATADVVGQRLHARGVTHVAWSGRPAVPYPRPLLALLTRTDLVRPVFEQGPDRLLALRPEGPLGPQEPVVAND